MLGLSLKDRPLDITRLRARARRKIAKILTRQVSSADLIRNLRRRACTAEAVAQWLSQGGQEAGRPRPELRAQDDEDVLLWGLFGGSNSGFYVEAGAFDGYTLSVSYLFECVGWTGVLIEPIPDRAAACAERRPNSRTVQAALSAEGASPEATFNRVASDELLSYLSLTESHRTRLQRERELRVEAVTVPVSTLDAILHGYDGVIDFVSLDIEGGELGALAGFDVERWQPRALLIEDNSLGADRGVFLRLEAAGYVRLATIGINNLYVRQKDRALVRRFHEWWGIRCPIWKPRIGSGGER